jgi:hypothetical protein
MLVNAILCLYYTDVIEEMGGQSLRQNRLIKACFEADDDHKYRTSNILLGVQLVDCLFSTRFLVNTKCQANIYQATQCHVSLTGTSSIRYSPNEKKSRLQTCLQNQENRRAEETGVKM